MTVKVYGKHTGCVQCDATKRRLDKLDIPFQFHDVDEDTGALEHILSLGYQQVPVVETSNDDWSGFRPDKLSGLTQHRKDVA